MATRYFKTDALVLHSRHFNESDRLVRFLTCDRGKIDAVVRGARKTKSKLAAGVEPFTYGHYVFYQGRSLATLTQQQTKENFNFFHRGLEDYGYALYFAELTDRLLEKNEPVTAFCQLLLAAWRSLNSKEKSLNRELLSRAYELKLLTLLGYAPVIDSCVLCGAKDTVDSFSAEQGGSLCSKCSLGQKTVPFSLGTKALASFLLHNKFERIKNLRSSDI
ncbi:MAG: DNA repair protein RecO, partial [Firmicutes bacterium]|nr:DNA repair protein RecO [Bacillota bacterium]